MTMDFHVTLDDPRDEGGLAVVLADLVRGNLDRHPKRADLLRRMRGAVSLVAEDGDESTPATLLFDGAGVTVRPGLDPSAAVEVRSGYEGIIGLSLVPVRLGLPVPWTRPTLDLAAALLRGRVRVRGMATNPGLVLRLLALFSVA